ncbi:arsenical-resistance protein [Phytophthora cinnamomi]|uniref:arsenical-resistance protein n=1 Tax=Phytophthora cinnamomi TaxID=4785 RepID=UPI00355AC41A|nr:arsenical-resistance protein [Phytophthora cinnamomi]
MGDVAKNVGIYMGAPFVAALLTWYALTKAKDTTWYFDKFTPRIGVLTLMALHYTIIVLNNFELALAVAIASFGLMSNPAQVSVVGALIEIPTMLALVYLAFWFRKTLFIPKKVDGEAALVEEMKGQADQGAAGVYSNL